MRSAARWAALAAPPAASTLCSRCGRPGGLHRTGWLRAVLVLLSHGPLTSTPQQLLPAGIRTCYGISVRVFSCRALFAFPQINHDGEVNRARYCPQVRRLVPVASLPAKGCKADDWCDPRTVIDCPHA